MPLQILGMAVDRGQRVSQRTYVQCSIHRGTQERLHTGTPKAIQEFSHGVHASPVQERGSAQLRITKPLPQRLPQVVLTPEIRNVLHQGS
jgi:hypothetical protein